MSDLWSSSQPSVNALVQQQLAQAMPAKQQSVLNFVSQEEHQTIFNKLSQTSSGLAQQMPAQETLYLEQQLSDMLGFSVSTELEGYRLPFASGTMAAMPHLRRFPTDTLVQHDAYREAGIRSYRSSFGWLTEMGQLTPAVIEREKYCFAVPASFVPQWQANPRQTKEWFKYRKMVMINPVDQLAVVGVVGDIGPANWLQTQFGGSPEVIREGQVWSMANRGHVWLFFIQDFDDTVPIGVKNLQLVQAQL